MSAQLDIPIIEQWLQCSAPEGNNVLTVLNVLMKKAVEWEVVDRMPCAIRLLPIPKSDAAFYDFDEYERLIAAAAGSDDGNAYLIVLRGQTSGRGFDSRRLHHLTVLPR